MYIKVNHIPRLFPVIRELGSGNDGSQFTNNSFYKNQFSSRFAVSFFLLCRTFSSIFHVFVRKRSLVY